MEASNQQHQLIWLIQYYLVLVPLTIIVLILLYKRVSTKSNPPGKKLPPSPPKLPIIGNLHQLGRYPHKSFRTLSQKYGDLMLIHIGGSPYLIVSSTKAARETMKTHDAIFANRPTTETIDRLFYNGKDVGTSQYGEYWRQMKSVCVLQLLSNKRVASFRGVREEETALLMENIVMKSLDGLPINLTKMLSNYTKDVICRVAFGSKYSSKQGTDFEKLWGDFSEIIGAFRIGDFIPWLAWTKRFDGWNEKIERVVKEFDEFLEQVLNQHQHEHQENNGFINFVDVLFQVQKEKTTGFSIGRESIKALMLDMFSGGMDTTSTLLEWTMAELLNHPDAMEELKKEVRGIVGQKSKVNEEDIDQMKYLKAVIKETLRLHPPVPFLGRLSTKDVKIDGYDIPAGTSMLSNTWAIQRDDAYWEDPDKFNPKRFFNYPIDFRGKDFELTPFGTGRRMCPGIPFTLIINELVLSNLMHKFDWIVPDGINSQALDMSETVGSIIRKKTPLVVIAKVRTIM